MASIEELVQRAEDKSKRILVWLAKQGTAVTWCMRFRLRTITRIQSDELSLSTSFRGHAIEITARDPDKQLRDTEWLILSASGFSSPAEAATFGLALQKSVSVTAALRGAPINVGDNLEPTLSLANATRDAMEATAAKAGEPVFIEPDAHGVTVQPDAPICAMFSEGNAEVGFNDPTRFFAEVAGLSDMIDALDERGRLAALLLNGASMAKHPVASLALSISAVELVSATERWNDRQKAWINKISTELPGADDLTTEEREELKKAAEGMYNFGALEKTRRLIRRIGREDLLEPWKTLYNGRSKFFHGARYLTNVEIMGMAASATTLCGEIVKAYIRQRLVATS